MSPVCTAGLVPLRSIPHPPLQCFLCIVAGLTLRAAVPKLLGLLASGWGQPKGALVGDQRAGEGRTQGASSAYSALSSGRCFQFPSDRSTVVPSSGAGPNLVTPLPPTGPAAQGRYSTSLLLLSPGLPLHLLFTLSAFSSLCDQIHSEFHVCYTLRVIVRTVAPEGQPSSCHGAWPRVARGTRVAADEGL